MVLGDCLQEVGTEGGVASPGQGGPCWACSHAWVEPLSMVERDRAARLALPLRRRHELMMSRLAGCNEQ